MPKLAVGKVDPARWMPICQIGALHSPAAGDARPEAAAGGCDDSGVTLPAGAKIRGSGRNRISAGRLFNFAQALDVNVAYFFEGLSGVPAGRKMQDRLMLDLTRNFAAISDPAYRDAVAALVRVIAVVGADDEDSA